PTVGSGPAVYRACILADGPSLARPSNARLMAARALEEGEGTILRVEDHLLAVGLARSVPGSSRRNMALATGGHGIAVAVSYSVVMPRLGPGIHEFVDGCCARRRGVRG